MGVGELCYELKVLGEIKGGIAQRCNDKDTLFVLGCLLGRFGLVEIDVKDGGRIDFDGFVVVEEDGGLMMSVPS